MAYKKTHTKALPAGAVVSTNKSGKLVAEWRDNRDRAKKDLVTIGETGKYRLLRKSKTYYCKVRFADGTLQIVNTRRERKGNAETFEQRLRDEQEKIAAGITTQQTVDIEQNRKLSVIECVDDFIEVLTGRSKPGSQHPKTTRANLLRVIGDCNWRRLDDLVAATPRPNPRSITGLDNWVTDEKAIQPDTDQPKRKSRSLSAHVASAKTLFFMAR